MSDTLRLSPQAALDQLHKLNQVECTGEFVHELTAHAATLFASEVGHPTDTELRDIIVPELCPVVSEVAAKAGNEAVRMTAHIEKVSKAVRNSIMEIDGVDAKSARGFSGVTNTLLGAKILRNPTPPTGTAPLDAQAVAAEADMIGKHTPSPRGKMVEVLPGAEPV